MTNTALIRLLRFELVKVIGVMGCISMIASKSACLLKALDIWSELIDVRVSLR